jgi:hypothetical protein
MAQGFQVLADSFFKRSRFRELSVMKSAFRSGCKTARFDVAGVRHARGYIAQGVLRQGKAGSGQGERLKAKG